MKNSTCIINEPRRKINNISYFFIYMSYRFYYTVFKKNDYARNIQRFCSMTKTQDIITKKHKIRRNLVLFVCCSYFALKDVLVQQNL